MIRGTFTAASLYHIDFFNSLRRGQRRTTSGRANIYSPKESQTVEWSKASAGQPPKWNYLSVRISYAGAKTNDASNSGGAIDSESRNRVFPN